LASSGAADREGRPNVDDNTSGYCRTRRQAPAALLENALKRSAQAAAERVAPTAASQRRPVKVVEGSTFRQRVSLA
jgi:hypothetical protein